MTETTTIDVTPTWSEILPMLMLVLRDGTDEGQRTAEEELRRMARIADKYVELKRHD